MAAFHTQTMLSRSHISPHLFTSPSSCRSASFSTHPQTRTFSGTGAEAASSSSSCSLSSKAWLLSPDLSFGSPNSLLPKTKRLQVVVASAAAESHDPANYVASDSGKLKAAPVTGSQILRVLQNANACLPYVVLGSTLLALMFPPSFSWFTKRYYAPALGFLMFAVGINLKYSDFVGAFKQPWVLALGYIGQFVVKPILGVTFAKVAVKFLHLPEAIGSGIILVSCVSGAQLSNYATFLIEPTMAPLSIVMTALSTATAVFVTPALTHLLLGQKLHVDTRAMMLDITQIVVAPITAGLAINKFAAPFSRCIRPFLPLLSVLVTGLCMGSPLALNIDAVRSPFGLALLLPILGFHATAFLFGFTFTGILFPKAADLELLQKTVSFETGMQSSLLGLALANNFFTDRLVALPSALSTVLMSLMGFGLVVYWNMGKVKH